MGAIVAGSILADKYRIDRPLAQGGMGSVWAAFDTKLEVPVAVKLTGSADLVARFEREAKAAAQLRSPRARRGAGMSRLGTNARAAGPG
jgi:serine/threonine-protein kinase